jgi:hypothetical protein
MLTNDMIMDVSEQREVRGVGRAEYWSERMKEDSVATRRDPRYHQYLAQCEREREERDAALDDNY